MPGGMKEPFIDAVAIYAGKTWLLFILQISHIKYIVSNVYGAMDGIQPHMEKILILIGHFLNNFENCNSRFLESLCLIKTI
jgi:hypothetical protein